MEKYVNKETLIKNDVFKSLPEDLIICPICFLPMIEPVMCLSCLNHFCKNCSEGWKKKSKTCPNGCENAILKTEIEKNRLITKLKFKCIKGCGAEILFTDIKNHYNSNCLENKEKEKEKTIENNNNKKKNKNKSESKIRILTNKEVGRLRSNKKDIEYLRSKQ